MKNITALLLPFWVLSGCYFDGPPRASSCRLTGSCTTAAPQGLAFSSSGFADHPRQEHSQPLPTIARNGTLSVRVQPFSSMENLRDPFTIEVQDPSNITVERSDVGLRINGLREEIGRFRLLRESDRLLLDTAQVTVRPVVSVTLRPWGLFTPDRWMGSRTPWVMYQGGTFTAVVKIEGALEERLVDESVRLEAVSGATVTRLRWDAFSVTAGSGTSAQFRLRAAGMTQDITVPIVSSVDRVEYDNDPRVPTPISIPTGGSTERVCFLAFSGERFVVGAPFTYTTNNASIDRRVADFFTEVDQQQDRGCVFVSSAPGSGQVTGTSAGQSASVPTVGVPSAS